MIETDLLEFVRSAIRSVWTLELAITLKQQRGRSFTPAQLVGELRASDLVVSEGLQVLQAAGLVSAEHDGTYRYAPASAQIDELMHRLEKLHRERPLSVTKAIFSAPNEKLQSFADAFKLKKD